MFTQLAVDGVGSLAELQLSFYRYGGQGGGWGVWMRNYSIVGLKKN